MIYEFRRQMGGFTTKKNTRVQFLNTDKVVLVCNIWSCIWIWFIITALFGESEMQSKFLVEPHFSRTTTPSTVLKMNLRSRNFQIWNLIWRRNWKLKTGTSGKVKDPSMNKKTMMIKVCRNEFHLKGFFLPIFDSEKVLI